MLFELNQDVSVVEVSHMERDGGFRGKREEALRVRKTMTGKERERGKGIIRLF